MSLHQAVADVIDCKNRTPPYFLDGQYPVVRTTNVRNGSFDDTELVFTDEDGFRRWTQRGIPQHGDLFFTREAPAGEICLVPEGRLLCMGQRLMQIKPGKQLVNSQFILYSFLGPQCREYVRYCSKGSTVTHLKIGEVRRMPVVVPLLSEQQAIAKVLSGECGRIDTLTRVLNNQLGYMMEFRLALISAAVTGKIDVREEVA
jgi:type I restriction enzyme S subunit